MVAERFDHQRKGRRRRIDAFESVLVENPSVRQPYLFAGHRGDAIHSAFAGVLDAGVEKRAGIPVAFAFPDNPQAMNEQISVGMDRTPCVLAGNVLDEATFGQGEHPDVQSFREAVLEPQQLAPIPFGFSLAHEAEEAGLVDGVCGHVEDLRPTHRRSRSYALLGSNQVPHVRSYVGPPCCELAMRRLETHSHFGHGADDKRRHIFDSRSIDEVAAESIVPPHHVETVTEIRRIFPVHFHFGLK